MPHTHEWDEQKSLPLELYKKTYEAGILPGVVGAPWAGGLGHKLAVAAPENFDYFHELIILDEFGGKGSGGVLWGLLEGVHIGLPGVELRLQRAPRARRNARPEGRGHHLPLHHRAVRGVGRREHPLRGEEVGVREVLLRLRGKKVDHQRRVGGLFHRRRAHGRAGMGGISLLVVEKTMPGVTCKRMDCMGVWASGTTYVTFEDVRVLALPNLVGKENEGFKYVMHNFNHERWGFVVQANLFARVLRGGVQVRTPKADVRQEAHRAPRDPREAGGHDPADRRDARADGDDHLPDVHDGPRRKRQSAGGDHRAAKVQSTKVFEYCAQGSRADLRGRLVRAWRAGGEGRAPVPRRARTPSPAGPRRS